MVQSFQVLRNVYILNITSHHMSSHAIENHPKSKHILVLRRAKDNTSAFFI